MRLLLTADLHLDPIKLRWPIENAQNHDALLVAGDILNLFEDRRIIEEQATTATGWKDDYLKTKKSLAWCSGNHDFLYGADTPIQDASPLWMKAAGTANGFVSDGETRLLKIGEDHLIVTTLPWPALSSLPEIGGSYLDISKSLLASGRELKAETGAPWIVLNHEPPEDTPLAAGYLSNEADFSRRAIEAAQPDFSLHGHIHEAPGSRSGSWIWQIGKTICFNAGQSHPGQPIHHIYLKWRDHGDWTAIWHGNGMMLRAESSRSQ